MSFAHVMPRGKLVPISEGTVIVVKATPRLWGDAEFPIRSLRRMFSLRMNRLAI